MTREEHIIYLKNLRTALKLANNFSGETMESLNKAIEALEAEPCVDAISRKAMLEYQEYLHGKMPNDENYKLSEFIKGLSSVTPQNTERKTGEILTDYEIYTDKESFERRVKKTTRCSLCSCDLGWNGDLLTYYCPNCGVRLEYKGR